MSIETTKNAMQFKGNGKEYFKIWIVNVVLSILTLGIYSAWATVRTKKYFYGNTFLDEGSFDYHGTPWQTLIGRIIAIGIITIIVVILRSNASLLLSLVVLLTVFLLMPFAIQRSLRFSYSVTSFRNIRFAFDGKAVDAYEPYFWMPIVSVATLNFLYPFVHHAADDYRINNSRYGNLKFHAQLHSGYYFIRYVEGAILALAILMILLGSSIAVGMLSQPIASLLSEGVLGRSAVIPLMFLYLVVIVIGKSYIETAVRKHYLSNMRIAKTAHFDSTMKARGLLWIYVKNSVLLLFTIGVYYPWAKVNLVRYRVENTMVYFSDNTGDVFSEQQHVSALGNELVDAFDMDVVGI